MTNTTNLAIQTPAPAPTPTKATTASDSEYFNNINSKSTDMGVICDAFEKHLTNAPASVRQAVSTAKGVAFLRSYKMGCIVTIRGATGAVVVRRADNSWSNPCAVKMGGVALGADIGVENAKMLLVLKTDNAVRNLMAGTLGVGLDASIVLGPVGKGVEVMHLETEGTVIYSVRKGLYGGASINFTALKVWTSKTKEVYPHLSNVGDISIADFEDCSWLEHPPFAESLLRTLSAQEPKGGHETIQENPTAERASTRLVDLSRRIAELKKLFDAEAITHEEFETKKTELLAQM